MSTLSVSARTHLNWTGVGLVCVVILSVSSYVFWHPHNRLATPVRGCFCLCVYPEGIGTADTHVSTTCLSGTSRIGHSGRAMIWGSGYSDLEDPVSLESFITSVSYNCSASSSASIPDSWQARFDDNVPFTWCSKVSRSVYCVYCPGVSLCQLFFTLIIR